ncbi:MAG: HNH endonuclease [Patescibacteria group bacterium]|nr:HNH endonuclease [Patescibacteria group bacterium]MDE2438760.1 HNH endonuclease [Patescibacteria group bacterium]
MQEHFGQRFYLDKDSGYWISVTFPKIRAHRFVWEKVNGKIPKGFHIHHKDGNKSNNDINNLECLSPKEHIDRHFTEERRNKNIELMHIIRPLASQWHSSEEGKEWHKKHAEECGFGHWEEKEYTCLFCRSIYKTSKKSGNKFCSNKCKSRFRRKLGVDNVYRNCERCGINFSVNKYSKKRFCSRKCGHRWDRDKID